MLFVLSAHLSCADWSQMLRRPPLLSMVSASRLQSNNQWLKYCRWSWFRCSLSSCRKAWAPSGGHASGALSTALDTKETHSPEEFPKNYKYVCLAEAFITILTQRTKSISPACFQRSSIIPVTWYTSQCTHSHTPRGKLELPVCLLVYFGVNNM